MPAAEPAVDSLDMASSEEEGAAGVEEDSDLGRVEAEATDEAET